MNFRIGALKALLTKIFVVLHTEIVCLAVFVIDTGFHHGILL